MNHKILRIGCNTYLEINGSGYSLSINLGNVDPANPAAVRRADQATRFGSPIETRSVIGCGN